MLKSIVSVISELNQLILQGSCIKMDDTGEGEEKRLGSISKLYELRYDRKLYPGKCLNKYLMILQVNILLFFFSQYLQN